jgi:hypothetical protein
MQFQLNLFLDLLRQADADNLPAVKAILAGLKTRYQQKRKLSTLIHTVC